MTRNVAFVITRAFDPIISTTIYLSLIIIRSDLSIQQMLLLSPIVFLLALLLPGIYFSILLREGKITDWDTTERTERFPLFIFTISCWTVVLFFIMAFGTPLFLHSFLTFYILGLFLAGITFFWKISVHAALLTLAVVYLVSIEPQKLWWTLIFIPITLWSRYFLKKHSPAQLFAGSLLAIIVFFATISV